MTQNLDSPVQFMKGVGPFKAKRLEKLQIKTMEDLLYYLPWRYEDRCDVKRLKDVQPDMNQTVMGRVKYTGIRVTPRKRIKLFELIIEDSTGFLKAVWFNQPYLKDLFKKDQRVVLSGLVTRDRYERNRFLMENPSYEFLGKEGQEIDDLIHMGRIVPIYHETLGCSSKQLRVFIRSALRMFSERLTEFMPLSLREGYGLPSIKEALETVHFPKNSADMNVLSQEKSLAHRRLIFDEFFLLELGLGLRKKQQNKEVKKNIFKIPGKTMERVIQELPFQLTRAQQRVIREIQKDMAYEYPMNRLLQGDVGCGKTIVAVFALLTAVENNSQAVLMAPTEILAEQHYLTLKEYADRLGINIVFLTSSVKKKDRVNLLSMIQSGKVHVVVGTHSLIQEDVCFPNLGLAIIDEQHKFGVMQRALLRKKGYHPDVLIMTATPIPRTLALSVYGDLDLSIIDELPPGRSPIQTQMATKNERPRMYRLIKSELEKGRQGYVVVPLIEESEKVDLAAAVDMAKHLQEDVFPAHRIGLLHGRMPPEERGTIMRRFKEGKIDLLVTTTVIEVGIDVPNATTMLIDHAERFGLSQLHQLRGRIGRGKYPSQCLLVAHYPLSVDAKKRLEAMLKYQDGFCISEEDLAIRGPGEFLGTRQSGIPELRVASIVRDARVLEKAREEAFCLLEKDPDLSFPEHRPLREQVHRRWRDKLELMNLG